MNKPKKIFFCTNLKMIMSISESINYLLNLNNLIKDIDQELIELTVLTSYTTLFGASVLLKNGNVRIGAQNVCGEQTKELTGEISAEMLKDAGAQAVMIGHAERRKRGLDDYDMISNKVKSSISYGMNVFLCVGELSGCKDNKGIKNELSNQIETALDGVLLNQEDQLRIVYEPSWAIGCHGMSAEAEYVVEGHEYIRGKLNSIFGREKANCIPILYGGSVNLENAAEYMRHELVDGLGIGRSAFDAHNYYKIIRSIIKK